MTQGKAEKLVILGHANQFREANSNSWLGNFRVEAKQAKAESDYSIPKKCFRVTVTGNVRITRGILENVAEGVVLMEGMSYYESKHWGHDNVLLTPTGASGE